MYTTASWNLAGIFAAILIVAGIALLIAYALGRGLDRQDLDGTEPEPEPAAAAALPSPTPRSAGRGRSRTLGSAGAALLLAGLLLGVLSAATGWGSNMMRWGGPGTNPNDCAQTWNGCPQSTP